MDVEGIDGAELPGIPGIDVDVVPPGTDGVPPEGAGEGVDGAGEPPPPGMPPESPDGLGAEGAPPPEFDLQPLPISTAPMAIATSDARNAPRPLEPASDGVVIG